MARWISFYFLRRMTWNIRFIPKCNTISSLTKSTCWDCLYTWKFRRSDTNVLIPRYQTLKHLSTFLGRLERQCSSLGTFQNALQQWSLSKIRSKISVSFPTGLCCDSSEPNPHRKGKISKMWVYCRWHGGTWGLWRGVLLYIPLICDMCSYFQNHVGGIVMSLKLLP